MITDSFDDKSEAKTNENAPKVDICEKIISSLYL